MNSDFMTEKEVSDMVGKKRTALYHLRKKHGFPAPVLTHPAKYSRQAVEKWIAEGGVNRAV
ncbi:regulatory phage cox family protein [Pseudescherichia vulneris]|uniref:helix-turn-helix transcriptional regulator n=1 Tax=Pseudescherichia vulneris TaxID=566 RepID=UPI00227BBFC7|nr:Cox family DNA-binding protein [Pseudescherichia vulneris]WAH52044.1 regulatory phage cox family protein [Pseudescherichia vulneris]